MRTSASCSGEIREVIGWGDFQLRRHLARLIELEYVLPQRSSQRNGRQYQLLYGGEGRQGQPFLLGLIDTAKLSKQKYDSQNDRPQGQNDHFKRQNDARSMPLRSAVDAPLMVSKRASTNGNGHLRSGGAAVQKRTRGPAENRYVVVVVHHDRSFPASR